MRCWLIAILLLFSSACTSLLVGNASSGDSHVATASQSGGAAAEDQSISAAIGRKLAADAIVGSYAIGIRTVDNVVTLSGTVGSFAARDRAVQIASTTDRVDSVTNRIVVNTNL